MSSSSDFRAVDLDAVLDEFESSQDLVTLQDEQKIESCSMTVADDSNKPNLLEDLQTQEASTETMTHASDASEALVHDMSKPQQPDVLSGLMTDSLTLHLEVSEEAGTTSPHHGDSSDTSKSSDFESIYDKYRDKSEEEPACCDANKNEDTDHEIEEEAAAAAVFQSAELSNDELNQLFEQLGEEGAASAIDHDHLGARPKEFLAPAAMSNDGVPDIVMDTDSIPKDSPPPYSEIDPMKRPDSLDLESSLQNFSEECHNANVVEVNDNDNERPQNPVDVPVDGGALEGSPAIAESPDEDEPAIPASLQGLTEDQLLLGKIAPFWIPDSEAASCMICDAKFTMVRRRHHCRACGQVLCSLCCSDRSSLSYMDGKEGRVCKPCKGVLAQLALAEDQENSNQPEVQQSPTRRPNPANPMEYCSTISPLQQVSGAASAPPLPSVMVPVGVLKRPDSASGEGRPPSDPKSVMFSDGIRPGGDLTELDGSPEHRRSSRRSSARGHKKNRARHQHVSHGPVAGSSVAKSLIPPEGLPFVTGHGPVEPFELVQRFRCDETVSFSVNRNLRVCVKLVHYTPVSEFVWNFKTEGMNAVGQDEIVILLVKSPDEDVPPRDIFEHLQELYETAGTGAQVGDMGYSVILSGSKFLGSTDFGGFLYFRHSFQCLDGLDLPKEPFLFSVLITKWEMSWARVFPLRLLLRLGAESRYYPTPLWSWRERTTVYKEIGQTIMKVLCDFRNFTYSLPIINGMVIHMEDKLTTVLIPQNSYGQIQKALQMSNNPVLALGGNFSPSADSHLVAVQRDDDEPSKNPMNNSDYETQAINIQNKARKVTGASFIVLSGALKKSTGLTAKSSIVDDGIMVQISQDRMMSIRKSLNNMESIKIDCGPVGSENPDETVHIKWVDAHHTINAGIKSLIDGSPMDGIMSIRMNAGGTDYVSGQHLIRWTEVFLIPSKNSDKAVNDQDDPARAAGHLARAICMALTPNLAKLKEADLTPLAVRATLDPECACYEAGSKGQPLLADIMNHLDNELVPIIHGQSSTNASFEFVFHILDI